MKPKVVLISGSYHICLVLISLPAFTVFICVSDNRLCGVSSVSIISTSLTINITERMRSWNRPVTYPMCRSVCLNVCPESVLWQNS